MVEDELELTRLDRRSCLACRRDDPFGNAGALADTIERDMHGRRRTRRCEGKVFPL